MEEDKNYDYYVVEFQDLPREDFDKYVCIPNSWIALREISDQTAVVKYPEEPMSVTKKRVKKKEIYSNDWNIFDVDVKFGTDSYKEAKKYITALTNLYIQEKSYEEIINNDTESVASNFHEGNPKIEKIKITTVPSNDEMEPSAKTWVLKQTPSSDPNIEPHKKITEADGSKTGRRYFTRQVTKSQFLGNAQPLSNDVNSLDTMTPETCEVKSNDCIKKKTHSKRSKERESPVKQNTPPITPEPINKEESQETIFSADFPELLKNLYTLTDQKRASFERISLGYAEQCTMIKEMIKLLENFNNFLSDPVPTTSEEISSIVEEENEEDDQAKQAAVVEIQKKTHKGVVKGKKSKKGTEDVTDGDNDNIEGGDKSTVVLKKRVKPRKFTLPPDYDKDDSRWTLKHREKQEGLVELLPDSNIYVNELRLSNYKRLSKDSKMLARLLLTEIFTESALRTCSLTGRKANAFYSETLKVRPGLDEHARTVLLNFVEEYSRNNNWVTLDNHSILNTLRNKMQDMRSRC